MYQEQRQSFLSEELYQFSASGTQDQFSASDIYIYIYIYYFYFNYYYCIYYTTTAGPERDPMDDAEIDREDEVRQYENECCGEARYNCGRFTSVLAEQGRELRAECAKIDLKKKARGCFSVDKLRNFLPIIEWAPKYRFVYNTELTFFDIRV